MIGILRFIKWICAKRIYILGKLIDHIYHLLTFGVSLTRERIAEIEKDIERQRLLEVERAKSRELRHNLDMEKERQTQASTSFDPLYLIPPRSFFFFKLKVSKVQHLLLFYNVKFVFVKVSFLEQLAYLMA